MGHLCHPLSSRIHNAIMILCELRILFDIILNHVTDHFTALKRGLRLHWNAASSTTSWLIIDSAGNKFFCGEVEATSLRNFTNGMDIQYIYICILNIHVHLHAYLMYIYIYTHVYIYIYMYIYIWICVYVYMCIYIYMYMCICVHVYMYICMYVCMYVCMHACMYIYVNVWHYIMDWPAKLGPTWTAISWSTGAYWQTEMWIQRAHGSTGSTVEASDNEVICM